MKNWRSMFIAESVRESYDGFIRSFKDTAETKISYRNLIFAFVNDQR